PPWRAAVESDALRVTMVRPPARERAAGAVRLEADTFLAAVDTGEESAAPEHAATGIQSREAVEARIPHQHAALAVVEQRRDRGIVEQPVRGAKIHAARGPQRGPGRVDALNVDARVVEPGQRLLPPRDEHPARAVGKDPLGPGAHGGRGQRDPFGAPER